MNLLKLLQEFFWVSDIQNKLVYVRIVLRNEHDVVIAEKYVPIQSVYNPLMGPIGININQKDINSTNWKTL